MLRLVHELEVHQVELEMQNDELRRTQAEVEGLRQRYQDLYDFAPVSYITLDEKGTIREANLTGAISLGQERSRLLGSRFTTFISSGSLPAFQSFMQCTLHSDRKESCEVRLTRNGEPAGFLLIQGIAVTAAEGKSNEVRASLIDITGRKEMEERIIAQNSELERKATELAEANQGLAAFGNMVTHELRRPITCINSAIQVIEEEAGRLDPEGEHMVEIIRSSSNEMDRTVSAIFNLSRAVVGPLCCRRTDLSRLAADIASVLRLADPDLRVEFVIPSGLTAECDPELIRIALENLLGNACKHIDRRGAARIEFGVAEKEGERVWFVRDNGGGFDTELASELFVPFRRCHAEGEFTGSGIGLATVRRIVERHGGRVWAEGSKGRGATFYFTLPAGCGPAAGGLP